MPTPLPCPVPFRPLGDRVLILPDEAPGSSPGGILLPDNAREVPSKGTVLAVGTASMELHPGDRVLFSRYAGSDVEMGTETLKVLREEDVMLILLPATEGDGGNCADSD